MFIKAPAKVTLFTQLLLNFVPQIQRVKQCLDNQNENENQWWGGQHLNTGVNIFIMSLSFCIYLY